MKTQASVEEAKKVGTEMMAKGINTLTAEEVLAANQGPPQAPLRGVPGFLSAFAKEVRRDIGIGK